MRTKATFFAGFATGYVLGARAGRGRYEQIRQAARSFASNPAVQSTASTLQHQAGDALHYRQGQGGRHPRRRSCRRSARMARRAPSRATAPAARRRGTNGHRA